MQGTSRMTIAPWQLLKPAVLALLLIVAASAPALAQWPTKTVRIMVPFGPGSTPDIVARIVADGLSQNYPDGAFLVEKQARRQRQSRHRYRRQGGARWQRHRHQHWRAPRHQHAAVLQAALRSREGYRAGYTTGVAAMRARGQSGREGREPRRLDRAAETKSGQIQFQLDRQRLAIASRHGGDSDEGGRATRASCPILLSPLAVTAIIRNDAQMGCLPAISVTPQAAAGLGENPRRIDR